MPDIFWIIIGLAVIGLIVAIWQASRQTNVAPPPPPPKHRVTLYLGNGEVREWIVTRYATSIGQVFILPEGQTEHVVVSGTYSIVPIDDGLTVEVLTENERPRFKIYLYLHGKVPIAEWSAVKYAASNQQIYFGTHATQLNHIVSGTCVVEPIETEPAAV